MKETRIVLVDEDADFCRRLDGCIRSRLHIPVTVFDYTEAEALAGYTDREDTSLLLIAERALDRVSVEGFPRVIVLTESNRTDGAEQTPYPCMYKYRPLGKLLAEVGRIVLECAAEQGVLLCEREGRMRRIAFFTPLTRCLQTTSALTLARLLAEYKKTMFLCLDPFSGLNGRLSAEGDLSDLLYFYECDRDRLALHIEQLLAQAGPLGVILPSSGPSILTETEKERWPALFDAISKQTDTETLVLDLSACVRGLPELLEGMDAVITITREDPVSEDELQQYDRMLKRSGHEQVASISHRVLLPTVDRIPAEIGRFDRGPLADHWRSFLRQTDWLCKEQEAGYDRADPGVIPA